MSREYDGIDMRFMFVIGVIIGIFVGIMISPSNVEGYEEPCIKEQVEVLNDCLSGSIVRDGYIISCINNFRFDLQSECKLNPQVSNLIADKILNQLIEPVEM